LANSNLVVCVLFKNTSFVFIEFETSKTNIVSHCTILFCLIFNVRL
jgi:hypothetical protein